MTDETRNPETQSLAPASSPEEVMRRHVAQQKMEARPERIGPYRILETLGEGGMGVVYLAEQTKPIHRRVALKIIKLGMDTKQVIARFETEREALALMNHPHVAKVFDAGATEQGRPYFVMEHVPGIPITDYCDKHRVTTEDRLRLFMDVCAAIQHAHQKGIIHRDIKPSNVLVTVQDGKPTVKVIDFGVAKATQRRLAEETVFTEQGQLIGTPGYMSPEQAEMTALDIDTRTDIYSLGVLLYELLVGILPFDTDSLRRAGLAEIQRIIRQVDPPKPSTRLLALREKIETSKRRNVETNQYRDREGADHEPSRAHKEAEVSSFETGQSNDPSSGHTQTQPYRDAQPPLPHGRGSDQKDRGSDHGRTSVDAIAHDRHTEPKTLIRQIRGDLDWIVMKCLEKDRTRRYDTANGLALEIQRYLRSEPVLAGPPSRVYRFKKFTRRNKGPLAAVMAVIVALLGGLAASTALYFRAEQARRQAVQAQGETARERDRANQEARTAKEVSGFLTDIFKISDPGEARGNTVTAREILDQGASRIRSELADQPVVQTALMMTIGQVYQGLGLYDVARTMFQLALKVREKQFGREHDGVAESLDALGQAQCQVGELDSAETSLQDALSIRQRLFGDAHEKVADTMNGLGYLFRMKRDFAPSESYYRQCLAIRRKLLGEDALGTAEAKGNLGEALSEAGDLAAAETLLRDALAVHRKELGSDHPLTLIRLNNLALLLRENKKTEEAEKATRELIETGHRVLGKDHPDVAIWTSNFASILQDQQHYPEAEQAFREALAMYRTRLGDDHPNIPIFLNNLGLVLSLQGKYEESELVLRDVVERLQHQLGKDHQATLKVNQTLLKVLLSQNKFDESESLARNLLDSPGWSNDQKKSLVKLMLAAYRKANQTAQVGTWEDELVKFSDAPLPSAPE